MEEEAAAEAAPAPVAEEKAEEAEEEELPAWLQAPAEPTDTGLDEFLKAVAPAEAAPAEPVEEPAAEVAPAAEVKPEAPPEPEKVAEPVAAPAAPPPEREEREVAVAEGAQERLTQARRYLEEGDIAAAVTVYEVLVSEGQLLEETIRDLSDTVERRSVGPEVYRVLGDAFMAQERLDEALEMYRKALDKF